MADQRQIERPTLYERVIIDDQVLSSMLAKALHITKAELALALGLPAETLRKREREQSRPTQRRMRGLVEILNPCQPLDRFGSASLCPGIEASRCRRLADGRPRIWWPRASRTQSRPIYRASPWVALHSAAAVPVSRTRVPSP